MDTIPENNHLIKIDISDLKIRFGLGDGCEASEIIVDKENNSTRMTFSVWEDKPYARPGDQETFILVLQKIVELAREGRKPKVEVHEKL